MEKKKEEEEEEEKEKEEEESGSGPLDFTRSFIFQFTCDVIPVVIYLLFNFFLVHEKKLKSIKKTF